MKFGWRGAAGWYHAAVLAVLPWLAWWRAWWAPAVAASALVVHRRVVRERAAEPWAAFVVAVSALAFVGFHGGMDVAIGWSLLAVSVGAVARYRPRRDGSRPDAADFLAVGGWAIVFVLAPRLVEAQSGGWLAPAVLVYAAQRAARTGGGGVISARIGAPSREVRGTLGLDDVVVGDGAGLPRSVPLDLDLRAGDSLAILCDAPADAALLADALSGRRRPLSGRVTIDGADVRQDDRLVAVIAPGERFVAGDLTSNIEALGDAPLGRGTLAAVRESCSLTEVAEALGDRTLAVDGEPLTPYHRLLVLVARVMPSAYRVLVVVDPMSWVNAVRGEIWRAAVVRASVGRTAVWITGDRDLARRAGRVLEYRQGSLRPISAPTPPSPS